MTNYHTSIDPEVWGFIEKTNRCYPDDTASRTIEEQRNIYDAMCVEFRKPRPQNLSVREKLISNISTRIYGEKSESEILYFHGGGFVVGGLESHDDICAEICDFTGLRLTAVAYPLSPKHLHPSAYTAARAVVEHIVQDKKVILVGDSAGGNLAAAIAGNFTHPNIVGQVLIYPALGGDVNKGSYITHANAPMLTRDDILIYENIRGGKHNGSVANIANSPQVYTF